MDNTGCRVLLIEDDQLDQMAFKRFVESESLPYDYAVAGSISEAQSILASKEFDIIVSDFSLGDGTALDILNSVKNIPIVLVTGAADEEVAIKAWKAGAYDYLPKDINQKYLKAIPKTIQNTIERKKMEEALERKQRNLEAIFDAAPVGMLLVDENMIITRANDAVSRMFHTHCSDIVDQHVGDALGCIYSSIQEDQSSNNLIGPGRSLDRTVKNVLDSGESIRNVEINPKLRIGDEEIPVWFRISAEPVLIDGYRHVVVAVNDITERKKAQRERQLAEEKYRTIFENSAVAITVVNDQERLTSWNKFMEGLLGFCGEELNLRQIQSLYPPAEWERIRAYDVRQKGMQHHLETKMIRKDGVVIDVDISLSVLKNSDGKTTGSIGVIRDITERKKAEEKLKETMEMKAKFISTVSHELRTPLAAMKEGVAIVLDGIVGELNEKQREFLNIAKRNVDRLNALINDVLDFRKLEEGRMTFDIQSNDIREVASEVRETMSLHAKKNQVDLSLALADDLPKAMFDRDKIIQVLTNLVSNAIKFTPAAGRVSVNIRHENDELIMSVEDSGMGIPKDALPKIFERFYRVSRPGQQIHGTGLGLAIVRKIVMMHGGRIEVESQVDQGTTFSIFLPIEAKSLSVSPALEVDEALEHTLSSAC